MINRAFAACLARRLVPSAGKRVAMRLSTRALQRLANWARSQPDAAQDVAAYMRHLEQDNVGLRKELADAKAVTPETLRQKYLELYHFAAECQSYTPEWAQEKWNLTVQDLEKLHIEKVRGG